MRLPARRLAIFDRWAAQGKDRRAMTIGHGASSRRVPIPTRGSGDVPHQQRRVPLGLLLDFGSAHSSRSLLRDDARKSNARWILHPQRSVWRGPLNPQGDPLWASMQRDGVAERQYWAQRAAELGAATGAAGAWLDVSTCCSCDPAFGPQRYRAPCRGWNRAQDRAGMRA
jgi:hypothetical protein